MVSNQMVDLFRRLSAHEERAARSFNMTPSENRLSPLAALPFKLDAYSRYFLDDMRLFGQWCFPAGDILGGIEQQILIPLLAELATAQFVNVRPISGMNCMTAVMSALTDKGDSVISIPSKAGGHASTKRVAESLGVNAIDMPFANSFDIDVPKLEQLLSATPVKLIYLDQSTVLFPIDVTVVRSIVNEVSPKTTIHYDSSHLNGLILGRRVANPLEQGAHSFGGSTHKTLPGPHKGFVATNSPEVADQIQATTDHFVSQHKMAEVVSLAITLLEFRDCGGELYAHQTVENAKAFGAAAARRHLPVVARDRGYTDCHQIWIEANPGRALAKQLGSLEKAGLLVNGFPHLPGMPAAGFRLSLAEFTRLGGDVDDAQQLANIFADLYFSGDCQHPALEEMRGRLCEVRYCADLQQIQESLSEHGIRFEL